MQGCEELQLEMEKSCKQQRCWNEDNSIIARPGSWTWALFCIFFFFFSFVCFYFKRLNFYFSKSCFASLMKI